MARITASNRRFLSPSPPPLRINKLGVPRRNLQFYKRFRRFAGDFSSLNKAFIARNRPHSEALTPDL